MKHFVLILTIAISCLPARASDHRESLTRLVDPFIGTGAINGGLSGNCYLGATCPFGMVQLSPDADTAWERLLGRIAAKGDTKRMKIFYTALYHVLLQPNTFSDVNGDYADIDYTTHSLPASQTQNTTFSLWDTFRAAHPLYTLIVPERVPDMVNSMIRQQHSYGYLPIWQLWGQENYCMIGNHAIPVVVDAVLKGFKGINAEEAYEAVLASATTPHPNSPLDVWERYGYMPEDVQTQSVSVTLEQAFDDWCACQLAKRLGKTADADRFAKRALFYKNLYNSVSHFFQPKNSKGEWMQPFDPYKYGANGGYAFTEGNAWQYYWYVPHNIDSLVALTGGKKAFANKLDQFFTDTLESGERKSPRDIYIKSARLNGHPLKKLSITHRQITDGGTLVFTMKGKP